MNKISLRSFQLKANSYLDKLPIVLTRYGVDIAIVQSVNTPTPTTHVVESVNTQPSVNTTPKIIEQVQTNIMWSNTKLPGYTYIGYLGKWKRDE